MLRFSDGINVDTSGALRKMCLSDGMYVVGNGMMIPVNDSHEANELIEQYTKDEYDD